MEFLEKYLSWWCFYPGQACFDKPAFSRRAGRFTDNTPKAFFQITDIPSRGEEFAARDTGRGRVPRRERHQSYRRKRE
jgi:hypothetical protein